MQRSYLTWLAGALAVIFLGAFLFLPLGVILVRSVSSPEVFGEVFGNPYYRGRVWFTTWQALLSTALTVLLALPNAVLFSRYNFRGKRLLRVAFTIPFVMPTVVAAIGFLALAGPQGVFGGSVLGRNTLLVILAAHVFYNYAVVVRVVGAYLETVGPRLRDAAATLGAGTWRTLLRVTLPLAAPALLAAAALVFVFSFTSFGVIVILAPQPRFATLEVEVYRLTLRLLQLDDAAVLVLAQLLVVGLFTGLYTRLQARLAVPLGAPRGLPRPKGAARVILALNMALAVAIILSPLLALTVQAFWTPDGLSLRNFLNLREASLSTGFAGAGRAVLNSLRFAVSSTLLSLFIGLAFAYAVVRGGLRWLDGLSLLPLATSAVTLGFGYLLVFPQLAVSPWGLTLAHSLIAFPFVARSLLPALRGLPLSLPDAARTLGAGPLRVLVRLELPLLAPALVAAAAFSFAVSMGEFGATLVITRPEYATLPVAIFDRLGRPGAANYGAALALSVLLMVITGAAMGLLERFGRSEL